MSVINRVILNKKQSKIYEKQIHQNTLKCLKDCSNYNLSISYNQRNETNYSFFSKIIPANKNNIFIFNHLSPNEIIRNISDNSINNDGKNLNSWYNQKLIDIGDNNIEKIIENEIINIPIEAEKLTYNFLDSSKYNEKYSSHRGVNLLIKFDLNDDKKYFVLDKNILYNIFVYKINAKLHEGKDLFEKEVFFLLDIKKIVKSIQVRIEYLQKQEKVDGEKIEKLFVPLLEYENIGLIVSPYNKNSPLYYGKIKTNFNSIVKQKFRIKSILIALNISSSSKRASLNIGNVYNSNFLIKNIDNIKNKTIDCITDETTSESSNYNSSSPKLSSNEKVSIDNIEFKNIDEPLNNSCILLTNNLNNNYFNLNGKNRNDTDTKMVTGIGHYYKTKVKKYDLYNKSKKNNYSNNLLYKLSNEKNKYSSYQTNCNVNTIIINSNDIFLKTLFNRYQDKSNSTCNLKILIEFLKIKMKKTLLELTIYDFFCSFYKVSSLSLKIPFFKNDGSLIQTTFTPSLHELNLNIQNSKIVQKIINSFKITKNNLNSSSTIQSEEEDLIIEDIDEFQVSINKKKSLVRIYFKEQKPYYLTESLFDKLEILINKLKCIKKLSIDKNVLLDKSYIGIEWNIINGNIIFSSSDSGFIWATIAIKSNFPIKSGACAYASFVIVGLFCCSRIHRASKRSRTTWALCVSEPLGSNSCGIYKLLSV